MPLTDIEVRKAQPTDKPRKLADGGGMYMLISPSGGKLWRMKYRFDGKEKVLALGVYPDVPLAKAREKRDEARKLLADGIDTGALKKAKKRERRIAAANSCARVVQLIEQTDRNPTMRIVTYSHARNALKEVLDTVTQDADITVISRRDSEDDAVVMSLAHYNSIMETLHLTSNPANAAHLSKSIAQLRAGKAKRRELLRD